MVSEAVNAPADIAESTPIRRLEGRAALVTGASQGIGRALALALAAEGCHVTLVGRRREALLDVARGCPAADVVVGDLRRDAEVRLIAAKVVRDHPALDLLVNCAGEYARGRITDDVLADGDRQFAINLRAPLLLTSLLVQHLRTRPSDVVFIGSAVRPQADVMAYASIQAARNAFVDALRDELSDSFVRVLSVLPGRTATPLQEHIFALESRAASYQPNALLQPEDVAAVVLHALALPRRAEVTEIRLRPTVPTY